MATVPRRDKRIVLVIALAVLVGVAAGLGTTTFVYAEGASYLHNDPQACGNCHVMWEQLAGWERASHRVVATCNDCHAPHHPVGKLWVKAKNGFFHSLYFTTGTFHEPIAITPSNRSVTEGACRSCHRPIVEAIDHHAEATQCIGCHRSVGHLH